MKKNNYVKKITFPALFLAIAYVLPFFTGQIQQIGNMLCPMHIPVLVCGFVCGAPWGLMVGILAPILRSVMLGMPPMFPTAFCMALELGVYGGIAGFLHRKFPKKKIFVYISLIMAMIGGRVIWGIAMFISMYVVGGQFTIDVFLAGAITNAIPGIILQIVLVPVLVVLVEKNTKSIFEN